MPSPPRSSRRDFSWTAEQAELAERLLRFAQEELARGIVERDRAGIFDMEG